MSFSLFDIDIIPKDYTYGVYFSSIENWSADSHRSLFGITIYHKFIYIDLFFVHLLGEIK